MRALVVASILGAIAPVLLAGPAMAQHWPKSCPPGQTHVCGQARIAGHTTFRCWCKSAGNGGSYGKAEIHKKNVPTTHPTGGPGSMRALGVRRPMFGAGRMRRWR